MGSFLSLDLFMFFVFFEIVLVPMYFLIGGWGYDKRIYAATKFFLYTMFGSAFMLVGLIATVIIASREHRLRHVRPRRDRRAGELRRRPPGDGCSSRSRSRSPSRCRSSRCTPGCPMRTPRRRRPARSSWPRVMLKLGTYGLLRFGVYLFPEASFWSRNLWLTLAVIGIIYGAIAATMQKDLKRLVAYSSVAHLGFIVLGTFAFTTQAITGGVIQMVNHGVSTGALFLLVGWIYERRHTRQIADLKGLQKVAPIFAAAFMLVMLSSIGVPGLNGFVGEFLILIGSFLTARWWTVVAALGVILAARVPAVGLPAGVPRRARRGQQEVPRTEGQRRPGPAAVPRPHRVHGHLPEAGARSDRAERRCVDRPGRGVQRLRGPEADDPAPTRIRATRRRARRKTARPRWTGDAGPSRHLRRTRDQLVRPLATAHAARRCAVPAARRRR